MLSFESSFLWTGSPTSQCRLHCTLSEKLFSSAGHVASGFHILAVYKRGQHWPGMFHYHFKEKRRRKRRLRGNPNAVYNYLKGSGEVDIAVFFQVTINRSMENGLKLCQGWFKLDITKNFFTERMVKHWNRFPRKWWSQHPWKC